MKKKTLFKASAVCFALAFLLSFAGVVAALVKSDMKLFIGCIIPLMGAFTLLLAVIAILDINRPGFQSR